MGKVIMIASGKGGTGKTTTAANLGAALSTQGMLTVLVDMDMGLRNLDVALGLESSVVYDFLDFLEGRCTIDDVLIKADGYENLYFIAAPQSQPASEIDSEKLQTFWEVLKNRFDFCIADSPAGTSGGFNLAAAGADMAIVVTHAETAALRDADRVISILEESNITDIKLVVNRVRPDMIAKKTMLNMDECMDILGIPMLGIIAEDEELLLSAYKGEPTVNNPNSIAGIAYKNIAKRLCGDAVPIMEFKQKSIWEKLAFWK